MSQIDVSREEKFPKQVSHIVGKGKTLSKTSNSFVDEIQHGTSVNDSNSLLSTLLNFDPAVYEDGKMGSETYSKQSITDSHKVSSTYPPSYQHPTTCEITPASKPIFINTPDLSSTLSNFARKEPERENVGPKTSCKPKIIDSQILSAKIPISSQHSVNWSTLPARKPILIDAPGPSSTLSNLASEEPGRENVGLETSCQPTIIDSQVLSATIPRSSQHSVDFQSMGTKASTSKTNHNSSNLKSAKIFRNGKHYLPTANESGEGDLTKKLQVLKRDSIGSKQKNTIVPPFDDFAIKKFNYKSKNSRVEDAIVSCSSKIEALIDLNMKVEENKLNGNTLESSKQMVSVVSTDGFWNLLEEDWLTLSVEQQKELFPLFLDEIDRLRKE